jgi:hypothetical protein
MILRIGQCRLYQKRNQYMVENYVDLQYFVCEVNRMFSSYVSFSVTLLFSLRKCGVYRVILYSFFLNSESNLTDSVT